MPVSLVSLGPKEAAAASLLARSESVRLCVCADQVARWLGEGFVEAPEAIETFVPTTPCFDVYPRRYRKKLRQSLDEWARQGLSIEWHALSSLGERRFLDDFYFPILLPYMYARGIAPHDANEQAGVRRLLREPLQIAVLRTRDKIAGAALFRPGLHTQDRARVPLAGALPDGDYEEGLIYALRDEFGACRRALMLKLAEGMAERGFACMSLGRDLPWCEHGYDGVLSEKLQIATSVVLAFGPTRELYRWQAREGDRLVFLGWDQQRSVAEGYRFGEPSPGLELLVARLEGHGVRFSTPGP